MSKKESMPYTRMIYNEIIKEIEVFEVQPPNFEMNSEFKAGAETMKRFITDSLKKKKLP